MYLKTSENTVHMYNKYYLRKKQFEDFDTFNACLLKLSSN